MATAFFFGVSAYADVFRIALRAPNLLQNLLGEGTISAAFIPIYSRMLEEGREQDAGRFAGAIFGLVLSVASTLVLLGIAFAPVITGFFVPGWIDDAARVSFGEIEVNRFDLTVRAVRIVFPMTGILVLSAWALGVLNSHRRFFLPDGEFEIGVTGEERRHHRRDVHRGRGGRRAVFCAAFGYGCA